MSDYLRRNPDAEHWSEIAAQRLRIIDAKHAEIERLQKRVAAAEDGMREMIEVGRRADAEVERLREIEARAKLVISEWRRYGGDIKAPIVDQLEDLEELLRDEQSNRGSDGAD